ncbi:hypothetical protein [Stutzerimonas nitrititolerans]|uniref:hypothetical protein n=1 Tax=Stutzerimonas nitrititolerans TaxID=2482751 RepID=UPI0028A8D345|nr:hypothetical protein [Stutzerimonas nitrititolerans]
MNVLSWWPNVETFLKIAPGLILLPFTAWLTFKKIGQKATFSYSITYPNNSEPRITAGILTNLKDKPLVVHSLYMLIDKDLMLPIAEYNPPLIVKSMECVGVESPEVSAYVCNGEKFSLDFDFEKSLLQVYAITMQGHLLCSASRVTSTNLHAYMTGTRLICPLREYFNGVIYNDSVLYALVYETADNQTHTAFIDRGGFISGQWKLKYNALPETCLSTPESVTETIRSSKLGPLVPKFRIYKLHDAVQPGLPNKAS